MTKLPEKNEERKTKKLRKSNRLHSINYAMAEVGPVHKIEILS